MLARVGIKLQVARYTSTRTVPDLVNEDLEIVLFFKVREFKVSLD